MRPLSLLPPRHIAGTRRRETLAMEKSWTSRPVLVSDAEQVAAHGCYRPEDASRRGAYAAWVAPRIEVGRYTGLFAVCGQRTVGGAGAVLLDWGPTRANPSGQMARIVNVFTDADYRRMGLARSLLAELMLQCEAMGIREFNLGASAEGRSLYGSMGFEDYPAEMRR